MTSILAYAPLGELLGYGAVIVAVVVLPIYVLWTLPR